MNTLLRALLAVVCGVCGVCAGAHAAQSDTVAANTDEIHASNELVLTLPKGVALPTHGLRDPATVWIDMIDGARREIDFGEFYVSGEAGPRGAALDAVITHLREAAARGVKIRFLMEAKGTRFSDAATLARVKAIPGLEFRTLDYDRLTGGGIIHAKYFLVDGQDGYVGSQNFDWRSLTQIHETGLHTRDAHLVSELAAIFDTDWDAAGRLARGETVEPLHREASHEPDGCRTDDSRGTMLVASPASYDPPGVPDSQAALVCLIGAADKELRIAVMDYAPLAWAEKGPRLYYGVIDEALRAAAARGVQIELLVADWNTGAPSIAWLKSLALVPNVSIRIVSFPPDADGFIPYARVLHSKFMAVDNRVAWVGTSNWTGGYLNTSRNIEAILRDAGFAEQLAELHGDLWNSPYATPLDVSRVYASPHPGRP
ncbi:MULTISPECIES: phospholipase D-like domain-containing protein [unclassified Paraburkholderia]|uniref:phospholipase D-like domain-containing protein n=1 Tax=unclassified Paraburkholderia TaxID=2615204 RepID=UPI002AB02902|nr:MULTISPECIES: phospholipase D-like domain-containing protein [unclassified Paraburkholderia]